MGEQGHYRGRDRRGSSDGRRYLGRSWYVAGALLCLVIVGVIVLTIVAPVERIAAQAWVAFGTAGTLLAVLLAMASFIHWRATGRAGSLRVSGMATLLVPVGLVDPLTAPDGVPGPADAVRLALAVTAALWLVRAVQGPEVDTGLRPGRQLAELGLVALALSVPLAAVLEADIAASSTVLGACAAVSATVWTIAGVLGVRRAVRKPSVVLGWAAWLALAVAVAELLRFTVVIDARTWLLAAAAVHLSGLLLAGVGTVLSLSQAAIGRRHELFAHQRDRREQESAQRDRERQRRHEVSNALLAIEGATMTLERHDERLSRQQRAELERALVTGIGDLRDLVLGRPDRSRPASEAFPIGEVIDERATLARCRGVAIEVLGDLSAPVLGDPAWTAQILDNLIVNGERHGRVDSDRPLTIAVEAADDRVDVWVMDQGPGVPIEHRERVFDRGFRGGQAGEGEGIGLHVARQLLHEQHGELRYEDRPAGGACFVLALRAAPERHVLVDPGADEVDDGR